MFFGLLPENKPFSAACLVVPQVQQNKCWALAPEGMRISALFPST
jgi:hypothetical protein